MKTLRPFLAILALVIIAIWPPTPANAQEVKKTTLSFTGWQENNPITFANQIAYASNGTSTMNAWSTTAAKLGDIAPKKLPESTATTDIANWNWNWSEGANAAKLIGQTNAGYAIAFGQGQFAVNGIQIDMNYEKCTAAGGATATNYFTAYPTNYNLMYRNAWRYTSCWQPDPESHGWLNLYMGAAMQFSVPGKRVTRVIIHTGIDAESENTANGPYDFTENKMKWALITPSTLTGTVNAPAVTEMKYQKAEDGTADVILTSKQLFGSPAGIFLRINPFVTSGGNMVMPLRQRDTGTRPTAIRKRASVSVQESGTGALQGDIIFRIKSIEVEYLDEQPLNVTQTFSRAESPVQRFDGSTWVDLTEDYEASTDKTTEKIRIGDCILEVDATGKAGNVLRYAAETDASKREVMGIGLYHGTKFRVYPDPAKHKMKGGADAVAYVVKLSHPNIGNGNDATGMYCGRNINDVQPEFDGTVERTTSGKTEKYLTVSSATGMSDDVDNWIRLDKTTGLYTIAITPMNSASAVDPLIKGTEPVIWISAIEMTYATTTAPAPAPAEFNNPVCDPVGQAIADGDHWTFANSARFTPRAGIDIFASHVIKYALTDAPLTDETFEAANPTTLAAGDEIKVDKTCYVNIRPYGIYEGTKESPGKVQSYLFTRIAAEKFTSVAALNKPENDGKLVTADFFINLIALGYTLDDAGKNTTKYNYFGRDLDGTPIKITTFGAPNTNPPLNISTMLTNNGYNTSLQFFYPLGITGQFFYNDGHPEIRVTDRLAEDPAKQYDYSGFSQKALVKIAEDERLKEKSAEISARFCHYDFVEKIEPDMSGREVIVRHLTCTDPTALTFTKGSETITLVKPYATTICPATTYKEGVDYTVRMLVDWDGTKNVYVPRESYPSFKPMDLSQIVFKTDAGDVITPDGNPSEGADIEFTTELLTAKFKVDLPAFYDPAVISSSQGRVFFYSTTGANMGNVNSAYDLVTAKTGVTVFPKAEYFEEGKDYCIVKMVVQKLNSNIALDQTDTVYIKVHDRVCSAPTFSSIAEIRKAAKEQPDLVGNFVRLKSTSIAVATVGNQKGTNKNSVDPNYIILKDIAPLQEGKDVVDLDCFPLTFTDLVSTFKTPYSYFSGNNNWNLSTDKYIAEGDSVGGITFRLVCDDMGNVSGDLSGMQSTTYFNVRKSDSWTVPEQGTTNKSNSRHWLSSGEPLLKNYLSRMNRIPTVDEGEKLNLTDEHVGKLIAISGVKITATQPEPAEPGIAALADDPVFTAKTSADVPLSWAMFASATNRAANQTFLTNLDETATYTLTGLVKTDGAQGHVIEVLDLKPDYARNYLVCDHPEHTDTYIEAQDFLPDYAGKAIKLSNVTISRTGSSPYVYSVAFRSSAEIKFTLVTTATANSWKKLVNNNLSAAVDGVCKTAGTYNLTGILHKDDASGTYSIDAITFEKVGNLDPKESLLRINGHHNGEGASNPSSRTTFPGFARLSTTAPEGIDIYIRYLDPATVETGPDATDAQKEAAIKEALAKVEAVPLADAPVFDKDMWISVFSCTPGKNYMAPYTVKITKTGTDVTTLGEIIADKVKSDAAQSYHFRKDALVTYAAPDRVIVTDGTDNVAIYFGDETEIPAEGTYLTQFVVTKGFGANYGGHRNFTYRFDLYNQTLQDVTQSAPAATIDASEPQELAALSTDSHQGTLVGLTDVVITGNAADGFRIKAIATAGQPDETDYLQRAPENYDFVTLRDIDLRNALGIDLSELLDDDADAKYRLVGYSMPDNDRLDLKVNVDNSHKHTILEFWPTEIIRRRKIEAPVITLSADKSMKAETATITCAEPDATIEYSVDGGTTWRPYTQALALSKSATIQARASKKWLDTSDVATASFTMQHKSAAPLASFTEAEGVTTVTLTTSREGAAAGSYKVYYTTDGTEPTTASTLYADPFQVKKAGVKLRAILLENDPEAVESDPVEWTVPFTPAKQPDNPDQPVTPDKSGSVTMKHHTDQDGTVWVELKAPAGADVEAIYYTTDGTTPTESSAAYVGEIRLTKTATVKAVLKERGKTLGDVVSQQFTVTTTGIDGIGSDAMGGVSVDGNSIIAPVGSQAYDMTGRRVSLTGLRQGVYIVRLPDGTALKVSIR